MNTIPFQILTIILLKLFVTISLAQNNPVRIACVGNSITYGYTLTSPAQDSYPDQLGSILGLEYQVKNFGVSSRTMLKKGDYPYWEEPELTQALLYNTNIVIILLGGNDTKSHNWKYKDEFISDYIAMIDTFKQLDSNPGIWICYPSPGFGSWTFAEDIYVSEMIPMIDQILVQREVALIDFHSPLVNMEHYFPDGIHPSIEGAGYMAKIVYQILTGAEIDTIRDVDVALKKPVTASESRDDSPPENMNDGDMTTSWSSATIPCWAVIDLGTHQSINMFQLNFSEKKGKGFQYIIETSQDSINWETAIDQSARSDTVNALCINNIVPVDARFIKLTVLDALYDQDTGADIWNFSVYKSATIHAPILTYTVTRESSRLQEIELSVIPEINDSESIALYWKKPSSNRFIAITGYRSTGQDPIKLTIKKEDVHHFYATAFKEGNEVISDTLQIGPEATTVKDQVKVKNYPDNIELFTNYPNPFNPDTKIKFSLFQNEHIRLAVYDVLGKEVEILTDSQKSRGTHYFQFNASGLASGIYFFRLHTGSKILTKKMLYSK